MKDVENGKEIMILIKEKKRGEERHIGERRESSKSRITKIPLWAMYTHKRHDFSKVFHFVEFFIFGYF